jgi:hypothetical protein
MSQKYPGGFITKTPTAPTSSAAPGIWTLDQAMQNQKAGNWPSPPSPYIEDWFSTYLYTGNSSTQTITNGINLSANGGLVWIKNRTGAISHALIDTARGGSQVLSSNADSAQADYSPQGISAFNSSGFTVNGAATTINSSSYTYASWTFAERQKFFDIVTYTGNGSAPRNIAHNLGSVPGCIMIKRTDTTSTWTVYHSGIGNTKALFLNADSAADTNSAYWNNTTPTSTVFTLGGTFSDINASGGTYVAYLFAHDAGGFGASGSDNVISCGSYTGNGSATGPVVTLGYEPQWVMVKRATVSTGTWEMYDSMRGFTMGADAVLRANTSGAEFSLQRINPTSTGFQLADSDGDVNANGSTYIYIAIRRGPMAVPTLGTSVFTPNTATYSANQVATVGFPVDMLMMKGRTITFGNLVYDRLRGLASTNTSPVDPQLLTSDTSAETSGDYVNTVNNTGYQISPGFSGFSSVNWNFRRAPGFFDEVCYTGTGSATTVTHNLAAVPEMMIVKSRSNGALGWYVYSTGLGPTKCNQLNQTNGQFTSSTYWNDTAPTSSVFTLGSGGTNGSGDTQVAYLFATCPGVSKVGSYTGNGASQTINCGFTTGSRFVLIKRTDSTSDWYVWDSARGIVAGNDPYLLLNSTAAEVTGTDAVDTDSTGFIVNRLVAVDVNENAGTYIFLAIA